MTDNDREQFGKMKEQIETLGKTTERIEKKLDAFIEKAESRFAPMWSAHLWIWFGGTVGVIIVGYAIKVIFSHHLQ